MYQEVFLPERRFVLHKRKSVIKDCNANVKIQEPDDNALDGVAGGIYFGNNEAERVASVKLY